MTTVAPPVTMEYKTTLATDVMAVVLGTPLRGQENHGNRWMVLNGAETKSAFDLTNDPDGTAWCIVAVTGVKDDVDDIIVPGAFGRTLRERQIKGVLGHDWNRPVAVCEQAMELLPSDPRLPATLSDNATPWPADAGALLVKARYILGTSDGRDAWEQAKAYDKDHAYSIGYKVTPTGSRHRGGIRYITDLDLYEFSPVLHGANRLATLQAVKAAGHGANGNGHHPVGQTTDLPDTEVKAAFVRDADYWGRPVGTLIVPGMKPRGPKARGARRVGQRAPSTIGTAPTRSAAQQGVAGGMGSVGIGGLRRDTAANLAARAGTAVPARREPTPVSPTRARQVAAELNRPSATVQDARRFTVPELNAAAAIMEGSPRAKDRKRGVAIRAYVANSGRTREDLLDTAPQTDDIPDSDRAIPIRRRISTDPAADAAEIAAQVEATEPGLFAQPDRVGMVRASRRATGDIDAILDNADQAGDLDSDRTLAALVREGVDPDEVEDALIERGIDPDRRDDFLDVYAVRYDDARAAQQAAAERAPLDDSSDRPDPVEDPELDAMLAEVGDYWEGDGEDIPADVERVLELAEARADAGDRIGAVALAEDALHQDSTAAIDLAADPRLAAARRATGGYAAEVTGVPDRRARAALALAASGDDRAARIMINHAGLGSLAPPSREPWGEPKVPAAWDDTSWLSNPLQVRNTVTARRWLADLDGTPDEVGGQLDRIRDELPDQDGAEALALGAMTGLVDGADPDRTAQEVRELAVQNGVADADVAAVLDALVGEAQALRRRDSASPVDGDALEQVAHLFRGDDTGTGTGGGGDGQDRGDGAGALAGAPADGVRGDDGPGDILPGDRERSGTADRGTGRRAGGSGAGGPGAGGAGDVREQGGQTADRPVGGGSAGTARAGTDPAGGAETGRERSGSGAGGGAGGVRAGAAGAGGAAPRGDDAGAAAPGVTGADQPRPDARLVDAIPDGGQRFTPSGVDDLAPAGERAKLDANLEALRVLRHLQRQAPARPATPQEQAVLARWAGWGGLPKVFDTRNTPWREATDELLELLSTDEWNEARRNTLNAHYTDARVTAAVWQAVQDLGFNGGRVLEPGSGSGNFVGFAPEDAQMVGVELDSTTAAISRYLYPDAKIRNESFADTRLPDGSFDAAVGNVPFGDFALTDRTHNRDGHSIHNHFILKSLALTRPGGIVAVLSSRYTMDSQSDKARKAMAELGDLVGAVRLPTGSHQRASGTAVIEDVLIFRRREPGAPRLDAPDGGEPSWINARKRTIDGQEITLNDHWGVPDDAAGGVAGTGVLGRMRGVKGQFGSGELIVDGIDGRGDISGLPAALDTIVAGAAAAGMTMTPRAAVDELPDLIGPDTSRHEGHIGLTGGTGKADMRFTQARGGAAIELVVPETQRVELAALIGMRDTLQELLREEAGHAADTAAMGELRAQLNRRYGEYVDRFGPVNRFTTTASGRRNPPSQGGFRHDPMSAIVRALETYDPVTGEATKADIFHKRAAAPREIRTSADTPADALALSMDAYGEINIAAIARMLDTDEDDARTRLTGLVYEQPRCTEAQIDAAVLTERRRVLGDDAVPADSITHPADVVGFNESVARVGEIEPAAAYLSGDVRRKLAVARAAAAVDPRFQANVTALEAVVPRDLGPGEIDGRLGAAWIPPSVVRNFLAELIDNDYVSVAQVGGFWTVQGPKYGTASTEEWGTDKRSASELVQACLEQRPIKITYKDPATDRTVQDVDGTIAAQAKAEAIQERFSEWLWEDPERARQLAYQYNKQFNSITLRSYDDAPMRTYPGMAAGWKPYAHQNSAVERIVNEPTALLGHVVGAGKTGSMVMGAAELRRLGLARKPAIVVPNHMLEQFSREYLEIYPNAKILAAGTKDLEGDRRREFVARAATGDWDTVILTQSAFEAIPMSRGAQQEYINRELGDMRRQLNEANEALARGDENSPEAKTVKKMEKAIIRAEEALKKKLDKEKVAGVTFEETGIDYLMVDELHMYSNLRTISNIQGAGNIGSDRATDLHMKLEHLRATSTSGRVATGATGTPIRNTVTQAYVMQRLMRPDLLREAGITSFDQWAATFGQVVEEMELKPEGKGFRSTSRFAKFRNVPELLRIFHTFADIKLAEDLALPTPDLRGGKVDTVTVGSSADLRAYISDLGHRADRVRSGAVKPEEDNMLKISGDGRKAALSMRMVGGEDDPDGGKIAAAADRIFSIHAANEAKVYPVDPKNPDAGDDPLPGSLQIVFMDMGTPGARRAAKTDGDTATTDPDTTGDIDSGGGWNGYDALREQLVARGVPAEQIRYIHEAKNDLEKAEMFAAARAGRISVLIGSSEKMGVGTNVQRRAVALHHLDAPWRPADVEQRDGRIMRQGNLNGEVEIIRYVTEGSFDAYMWQTLERKARFINQIMRGSLDVREIEDIGDTAMSYAEVKALATGNPDLLTKAKTDTLLGKLERLNRTHARTQTNLSNDIGTFGIAAAAADRDAALIDNAVGARIDTRGAAFTCTVGGQAFDKRADAAAAVGAALEYQMREGRYGFRATKPIPVVTLGGHTLMSEYGRGGTRGPTVRLYFEGIPGDVGVFTQGEIESSAGGATVLRRTENHLVNLESTATALRDRAQYLRSEVALKEQRAGLEFGRARELVGLRRKSARLAAKMNLDSRREKYGENGRWRTNENLPDDLVFDPAIDTDAADDPLLADNESTPPPEAAVSTIRDGVDATRMREARDAAGLALREGDQAGLVAALGRMGMPESDNPDAIAARLLLLPTEVQDRRLDTLAEINLARGQEGVYADLAPATVPAADLDTADLEDARTDAAPTRRAEVDAELARRAVEDGDAETITPDELGDIGSAEPHSSITPARRVELEQLAQDYAGRYGGPRAPGGGGVDNAARYIAEGHAAGDHGEQAYLADYIRANPELLERTSPTQAELAERARTARARREQASTDATALAGEAQTAFQAGDFDRALDLVDQAAALDPARPAWARLRTHIEQGRRDAMAAETAATGETITPEDVAAAARVGADPAPPAAVPDATALPLRVLTPDELTTVRSRPVAALRPGDRLLTPGIGMAYITDSDGSIRSSMGFAPFEVRDRVVIAVDGATVTARGADGREITQTAPSLDRRVLVIPTPTDTAEPPRDGPPDVATFGKMNAARREETLRALDDGQAAALRAAVRDRLTFLAKNRQFQYQGERTRMERAQTSLYTDAARREAAANPTETPEFTDREVLRAVGNENYSTDELARIFQVPQPQMLRALRRLEAGGYLSRNSGTDDGDALSGGRRAMTSLGWESGEGRDGDHDLVLARFDAAQADPEVPAPVNGPQAADQGALSTGWGKPYGSGVAYETPDGPVSMFRKGQRVRFYDADGNQVGPEQGNVAPAAAYALSQGWRRAGQADPEVPAPAADPLRPQPGMIDYSRIQRQVAGAQRDDNLRRLEDGELEAVRRQAGNRGTVGESVRIEKIRRRGSPENLREKAEELEAPRYGSTPQATDLRHARQLRERADDYERRDAAGIGRHDFTALPFGQVPADRPSVERDSESRSGTLLPPMPADDAPVSEQNEVDSFTARVRTRVGDGPFTAQDVMQAVVDLTPEGRERQQMDIARQLGRAMSIEYNKTHPSVGGWNSAPKRGDRLRGVNRAEVESRFAAMNRMADILDELGVQEPIVRDKTISVSDAMRQYAEGGRAAMRGEPEPTLQLTSTTPVSGDRQGYLDSLRAVTEGDRTALVDALRRMNVRDPDGSADEILAQPEIRDGHRIIKDLRDQLANTPAVPVNGAPVTPARTAQPAEGQALAMRNVERARTAAENGDPARAVELIDEGFAAVDPDSTYGSNNVSMQALRASYAAQISGGPEPEETADDAPAGDGEPFEEFEAPVTELTAGQVIDIGGGDRGTVAAAPETDDQGRVYVETLEGERLEYGETDRVLVVGGPAGAPSIEEAEVEAPAEPAGQEPDIGSEGAAPGAGPGAPAEPGPDEAVLAREDMEAAQQVEADALGLVEGDDGAFEVETDVADRQDRVEALLAAAAAGGLNLTERETVALGADRRDLVNELRLQEAIRRRDLQRRRDARARSEDAAETGLTPVGEGAGEESTGDDPAAPKVPAPTAPKVPRPRPGLAGATADLADAIEGGDQPAILRAAVRARMSLGRSRGHTPAHAALREALDDLAASRKVDPAKLRTLAADLRTQTRERRNTTARARRLAKRLETERLRGLIGQYDFELRNRGQRPADFGGTVPTPGPTDAELAAAGPPDPETDPDPGGNAGSPTPDFPQPPPASDPAPAFDRGDPDGPTGQARVTAMVDRLGASPWRLIGSDEQMLADVSGARREMRVSAARAAFGPVLEQFGPVVARRTNETMDTSGQLAATLSGRRGRAGVLDQDGATFALMVPAAQRPGYMAAMREASAAYKADLAAQRRAGVVTERPEAAPSAVQTPAVAPIGSAQPGRVGAGGRVRALAPRPMADAAAGVRRFDSVDAVVAHLRTVEQPDTSGPGRTNSELVRDDVIKNITSGAKSFLSPGGGLLAYRDEEYTPKPWRIIHTDSGVDVARIGGEVPIGAVLRAAPMQPDGSLYLDPAAMRRMIDAMERMTDARGRQIDWTAEVNAVDTDVRGWADYRPDGSFDPDAGGATEVRDAAALEAMRVDPTQYALTESFDAARFRHLRGGTSQNLNPDRVDGSALSTSLRDGFRLLGRSLNNGRRGNNDYRATAQLRVDQGHARAVNEAELRAASGEPEVAAALLERVRQAMAGESRRDGADGEVSAILDTLGELFSPVATEPDRLRGARAGDRIVLRGDGSDAPPRVLVVESAPVTALRRPDGTVVSRFALVDEVSGRRLSAESDTGDGSYAARIEPGRGGRAEAFLTQEAAGVWAFVPAGQELPASGEDLRGLSRRAGEAFRARVAARGDGPEPASRTVPRAPRRALDIPEGADPDAEYQVNCLKCGGAGRIAGYVMDGGRCWRCGGSGREMTTARKEAQRKRNKERAATARERKERQWYVDQARKRSGWTQDQYEADVRARFTVEPDGRVGVWRDEPGGEVDRVTVAELAARHMVEDAILRGDVPDPTPDESV